MGLHLPLALQYLLWIQDFATGNFGVALVEQRPVSEILGEAIPNTLQLTAVVFILQLIISIGVQPPMASWGNNINDGLSPRD